jgi:prepilin-type N-terminal cleavage/methylation domain-containing protein
MSRHSNDRGLTLIELLIALSILSVVITMVSGLLLSSIRSQGYSAQQDALLHTARLVMERMVRHTRQANRVLLPSDADPTTNILVLGGFVDNDGDGRYDEDPPGAGDEDGDGAMDEDPIESLEYSLDVTTKTLWEQYPVDAVTTVQTALAEQVDTFQVQRLVGLNGVILIDILLRLRDDQGRTVELQSRAFPRNQ